MFTCYPKALGHIGCVTKKRKVESICSEGKEHNKGC